MSDTTQPQRTPIQWGWRRFLAIGVFIICMVILSILGTWQATRYVERVDIFELRDARQALPRIEIRSATELTAETDYRNIELVGGTFEVDKTIVLTRRFHKHLAGLWPVTPYRFGDGSVAMVHTGWVPEDEPAALKHEPRDRFGFVITPNNTRQDEVARAMPDFAMANLPVLGEMDVAFLHEHLGGTTPPRPDTLIILNGPSERGVYPTPSYDHVMDPYLTPSIHLGYATLWYGSGVLMIWLFWAGWTGRLDPRARRKPAS